MLYNYAMHNPGGEQPHAHVMFCERELDKIERKKRKLFLKDIIHKKLKKVELKKIENCIIKVI
ncbi:Uncharacterised protein [Streptobacillus moniliformis]|nr:Uncharacterised protein [Streptobacillus moniliformis]